MVLEPFEPLIGGLEVLFGEVTIGGLVVFPLSLVGLET